MLGFLRARELTGVEHVSATHYCRDGVGVTAVEGSSTLQAVAPALDAAMRAKLACLFDLRADRAKISEHLQMSPAFLPGCWDPFELAIRAILGQQVSVAAARTLARRLLARTAWQPAALATADLAGLGILPSRCRTLLTLAEAAQAPDFAYRPEHLLTIKGIGPWTAQYIAMRASGDADAFPAGDLILRRAVVPGTVLTEQALLRHAERWRPYRAYAAIHLWTSQSTGTK